MLVACIDIGKELFQRDLLHRRNTDDLENFPEGGWQVLSLLGDGDQEIGGQRGPDLDPYPVGRSTEETSQTQVLLEPTEKQLDGPTTPVDQRDDQGVQVELVGQKDQPQARLGIDVADPAQRVRIALAALPRVEPDGLVATQPGGLVHGSTGGNVVAGVGFQSRYEEGPAGVQAVQSLQVEIPPVHHVIAARIQGNLVEGRHFVPFSLMQAGEDGNVAAQIQQHVEFHGGLALLPASPREQCQTQVDHGRVQGEQVGFQAQSRRHIRVQSLRPPHQHRGHLRENAPVAMVVGVGQIRACHTPTDTHVVGTRGAGMQARLDAAQTLPKGQLREYHGCKVIVRTQRTGHPCHWEMRRRPRQLHLVQSRHDLGKPRRSRIHSSARMHRRPAFQSKSTTQRLFGFSASINYLPISGRSLTGQP
jgi:hypothetical protein